jgi:hypothetical protein
MSFSLGRTVWKSQIAAVGRGAESTQTGKAAAQHQR